MKIGVVSDTHIPDRTNDLPVELMDGLRGVDMIIHAGDILDLSVLEKLKGVCADVRAVSGNMDPDDVRKTFPEKQVIKVSKYKIGLMHGYGHPAKLADMMKDAFKNDKVDIIVFGHSHAPFNEKKEGVLFFNPGSPTDKVFSPYNSYGIIEINDTIEAKIIKIKG